MCWNSRPWYCVVQLPGCGTVPRNTPERDLPSPRCQYHLGFANGSFKQQWLKAVLEQLNAHGHFLKLLLAIRGTHDCGEGGLCHLPEAAAGQGPLPPLGGGVWGREVLRASEWDESGCYQVCFASPAQPAWGWQSLEPSCLGLGSKSVQGDGDGKWEMLGNREVQHVSLLPNR